MTRDESNLLFSILSYYFKKYDKENSINMELFNDNKIKITNKVTKKNCIINNFSEVKSAVESITNFALLRVASKAGHGIRRGIRRLTSNYDNDKEEGLILRKVYDLMNSFEDKNDKYIQDAEEMRNEVSSVNQAAGSYLGQWIRQLKRAHIKAKEYSQKIYKMGAFEYLRHEDEQESKKLTRDVDRYKDINKKIKYKEKLERDIKEQQRIISSELPYVKGELFNVISENKNIKSMQQDKKDEILRIIKENIKKDWKRDNASLIEGIKMDELSDKEKDYLNVAERYYKKSIENLKEAYEKLEKLESKDVPKISKEEQAFVEKMKEKRNKYSNIKLDNEEETDNGED